LETVSTAEDRDAVGLMLDADRDGLDITAVVAPLYAEPGATAVPHAVSRKVPDTADAASTRYRMRLSLA
jgi:hypothetical protein